MQSPPVRAAPPIHPLPAGPVLRKLARLEPEEPTMSDTLPDRLATDPNSPFHDAAVLERGIGIRFNGEERTNIEEYCVSEGWVRIPVGKALDRHGNAMTFKYKGKVEPYFYDQAKKD